MGCEMWEGKRKVKGAEGVRGMGRDVNGWDLGKGEGERYL